jgi:hypothetical protein
MKGKHLVYMPNMDSTNQTGWYSGNSSFIRGVTGPFTYVKEDATWLTQKQAKVLIDSMRHRQHDVHAEPSFTVVY